jgi:predicted DNA-binding WGR domain protein
VTKELRWRFVRLEHTGGTKFYELAFLSKEGDPTGLCIRRYGSIGTPGQVMTEQDHLGGLFSNLHTEKMKRGYSNTVSDSSGSCSLDVLYENAIFKRASKVIELFFEVEALKEALEAASPTPVAKPELNRSKDPLWGTW